MLDEDQVIQEESSQNRIDPERSDLINLQDMGSKGSESGGASPIALKNRRNDDSSGVNQLDSPVNMAGSDSQLSVDVMEL